MTNLETVVSVLERHREARRWGDLDVARDVLAALGVPEDAADPPLLTEGEVAEKVGAAVVARAAANAETAAAMDEALMADNPDAEALQQAVAGDDIPASVLAALADERDTAG